MRRFIETKHLGIELPDEMLFHNKKSAFWIVIILGICLTAWIWFGILFAQNASSALYVLDVGQGDSQLIILSPENGGSPVKILIDGGRDKTVLGALDEALGRLNDKYIDIVILTHTDLDHIGGIIEVLKRYDVGIFASSGRVASSEAYNALQETLRSREIPTVVLLEKDVIRYGTNVLTVLSPSQELLLDREINETSLVISLLVNGTRTIFTGDIGFRTENYLINSGTDLRADILKVGHHGSKNSSGDNFIAAVRPVISIIGVGSNRYGHPADRVLGTLELAGSRVYRTDRDGTVRVVLDPEYEIPETAYYSQSTLATAVSIMTGTYKNSRFTTASLKETRENAEEFDLVSYKKCSFITASAPINSTVLINEIAWMGSSSGTTHEWIELRNISSEAVNMSGWQLINQNEKIHITFPQKSIFNEDYIVLARSAANETMKLNAKLIFTGALRNNNEGLQLFDNECRLMDEIPVSPKWTAGNNKTKQTMMRLNDMSWTTSRAVGGTPNAANI